MKHPSARLSSQPAAQIGRRSFLTAAGLGAGLALTGCGASADQPPLASGPADLEVWTNDPNYITYFTGWAETLSKAPGAKFDYAINSLIQSPDQVITKMLTSYMSGTRLPDLAGFEISQFARLQRDDIGGNFAVDLRKEIPDLDTAFYKARDRALHRGRGRLRPRIGHVPRGLLLPGGSVAEIWSEHRLRDLG